MSRPQGAGHRVSDRRSYTGLVAETSLRAIHVEPFRVRFDECGADGTLRTSNYLRYMQDAASVHSSAAGYTRAWYREHGMFWVVRHLDLHVHASSGIGDVLDVSTEVVGFRRIWARRRSEFRDADGRLSADAAIDWVLTTAAGRPTRVPAEIVRRFPSLETTWDPARLDLPDPPVGARRGSRRAEPHELDPMAHLNNAAYIDHFEALLDGVGSAQLRTAVPRRMRIEYRAPAMPGTDLAWTVWPADAGVAGTLANAAGGELARVLVEMG